MYWRIKKILYPVPALTSGNDAWQIYIEDRDGMATGVWHYENTIGDGIDFDALSADLVAAGYCPGDFGDCPP